MMVHQIVVEKAEKKMANPDETKTITETGKKEIQTGKEETPRYLEIEAVHAMELEYAFARPV